MAQKLDHYLELAPHMMTVDRNRDLAWMAYQDMYHCNYNLPEEMKGMDWIHKYVTTDPHDAIAAGVRTLSSLKPRIRKQPYASDQVNKIAANMDEKNLLWQLKSLDRRRSVGVVSDVVQSALLYGAVVMSVWDVGWDVKIKKDKGIDTKRMEQWQKTSRWVVNVHNPMDVHVRRSSYGTEAVLLCQERYASEIKHEWGVNAKNLTPEWLNENKAENERVLYYDYWDYNDRVVWIAPPGTSYAKADATVVLMKPQAHEMDFLPWIAMMGGTSLEGFAEHQFHPMLYPLYRSGNWETYNIVRTLAMSDSIARSASPRFTEEGSNPQSAEMDYADPSRTAKVPPGNTLRNIPAPDIDAALVEFGDRIANDMQRSTVSRILQGGDIPAGTAYSTLNLATQTAVGSLKPSKELAEKGLAEMFKTMLLWVKHTEEPLEALGSEAKIDLGENYVIKPDEIDEGALYLDVELTPDVPTDRLQRANAASIMLQLGYPKEWALEDLGVEDPQEAIKLSIFEDYLMHKMELLKQEEMQELVQEAQMREMEQQQIAQQDAMAQEQSMAPQGIGWDPSRGGQPPIQAGPPEQMLREPVQQLLGEGMPAEEIA